MHRTLRSLRLIAEVLVILVLTKFVLILAVPMLMPNITVLRHTLLDLGILGLISIPLIAWRSRVAIKQGASRVQRAGALTFKGVNTVFSAIVLVLGLAITVVGTRWLDQTLTSQARAKFERLASKLEDAIHDRFSNTLFGFKGLSSFYAASGGHISRAQFRAWVQAREIAEDFPGIRGIGFIESVQRSDLPRFVARERADGAPDFSVRTSGSAPDLFVIKHIEPLATNRPAWGYDVGSETARRQAAEQAANSGEPALTSAIVLVQDGQQRPGFLYYLPVYRSLSAPSTPAQRRAALQGLIYAPIVLEELLDGVSQASDRQLDYELFDGPTAARDKLIFDLDGHLRQQGASFRPGERGMSNRADSITDDYFEGRRFSGERVLSIGGHALTLRVSTTANFDAEFSHAGPAWFGVAGVLLSALLAVTFWLIGAVQLRAEALARRMTADLKAAKNSAEAALRENKGLLDTLSRYMIVSVTDAQGRIIDINETFCRISGYSKEELLGQNHRLLSSGVHDTAFWTSMWATVTAGQPWSAEVCNRAKDGSLYWVQSIIAPFVGADGRIEKYVSIRSDITASKRAEHELKELAERFALAIDGGNDGLWDWMNIHSHEEWWSPQFYRLLGYEPNEIPPDLVTFDGLLHPSCHAETFKAMADALNKIRPFDVEMQLRTKAGAYRWFRSRAKVFFSADGRPMRMAGSIQDIHDRKLVQQKIAEHSEHLSAIFSLSPDGFVSFGPDHRVSYASPAFTRLTGIEATSVSGLDLAALVECLMQRAASDSPPLDLAALQAAQPQPHPSGHRSRSERTLIEVLTPKARMLELRLQSGEGSAVTQVLHLRDVTLETEVDQMKSEFMSMAAHELRTPMTSIYGFTELLLHKRLTPEKQADLLGRIHRQSEVMIAIINELLDLARIEARRGKEFDLQRLDLMAVVDGVIRDFRVPIGRHAPLVQAPPAALEVIADHKKTQQAVLNVLSNAYKYSPGGGAVALSFITETGAEPGGRQGVRHGLRITDQGIGLTAAELERLGERFFRADKSGSIPGTGLGVSIVKEILELMGGRLEVSSEYGHGTQVTLWFKAAESP